jgi:hypothetical protein
MPVVNSSCSYIANITPSFSSGLQPSFVLSKTVGFAKCCNSPAPGVGMKALEGVNLLEEVEVALITAFECLVRLFAAKDFNGALSRGELE